MVHPICYSDVARVERRWKLRLEHRRQLQRREAYPLSVPLPCADRTRRRSWFPSGTGVFLVQPCKNANAGRMGDCSADSHQGFRGVRLVAVKDTLAEGKQCASSEGIQSRYDSIEPPRSDSYGSSIGACY